jgi:Holliday junction resolvase RusA-like endonuclease
MLGGLRSDEGTDQRAVGKGASGAATPQSAYWASTGTGRGYPGSLIWEPVGAGFVGGLPVAQSRGRAGLRWARDKDGKRYKRGHIYDDGKADEWKARVGREVMPIGGRLDGPMRMRSIFCFERPLRLCTKKQRERVIVPHISVPDWDNLIKSTQDAMRRWWRDDCQVCVGESAKIYAPHGHGPGMYWVVWAEAGEHPRSVDNSMQILIDCMAEVWESLTHERR